LALTLAAAVAPSAVPIYDGIGNPDEPYRYVVPPPDYRDTKPPTTATSTLKVSNGQSAAAQVNTAEFGPQLALFMPKGALAPPASATRVTVKAAPIAPPDQLPTDGTIVGNVYRITATAPGGQVNLIGFGNQAPVLDMRAPTAQQPGPVFEHLDNGNWTPSETVRIGNDIYRTRADELGDWVLVRRNSDDGETTGTVWPIVAGVLGASGLVVAVIAVRRGRRSGRTQVVSR